MACYPLLLFSVARWLSLWILPVVYCDFLANRCPHAFLKMVARHMMGAYFVSAGVTQVCLLRSVAWLSLSWFSISLIWLYFSPLVSGVQVWSCTYMVTLKIHAFSTRLHITVIFFLNFRSFYMFLVLFSRWLIYIRAILGCFFYFTGIILYFLSSYYPQRLFA